MKRILVVGAGAAGLAAAHRLHAAGYQVIILEARDRVGGRALTNYDFAPYPLEFGAEGIHGDRVVTWQLLKEYRLQAYPFPDVHGPFYMHLAESGFGSVAESPALPLILNYYDAAWQWVQAGKSDDTLRVVLQDWCNQNSVDVSTGFWSMFNAYLGENHAADLDQLGVHGLIDATYEGDGEGYFYIRSGYSTLFDHLAVKLDIRFSTPVQEIQWAGLNVRAVTATGQEIDADALVVTLPLAVLQSGEMTFTPHLPQEKEDAIQGLGAGPVDRIFMRFKRRFWPSDMVEVVTDIKNTIWVNPDPTLQRESAVLRGTVTAASARDFEALGEDAVQAALSQLIEIFGTDIRKEYVTGHFVAWGADPFTQMGYSYTPVNATGLRKQLAEAVDNRLFFAGEATNHLYPATIHGALESGFRAADEIIYSTSS
ncbi:FAD-dependent oxidoreductase [Chloroflexi bacterium TSY]|nr:FAD-dependent oxidoreductase [Chloroflexi bacterium TSY]